MRIQKLADSVLTLLLIDPVAIRSKTMSMTTDDLKQFSVGTEWMIKDLTSETGKKFNGKTCVIVSTFDVTSGRVGVRIKNVFCFNDLVSGRYTMWCVMSNTNTNTIFAKFA